MNYINMSNSNCAAQNYFTEGKKHDQVKHLGLGISDSTKRLKSDELYQHVKYQLRIAELLNERGEA